MIFLFTFLLLGPMMVHGWAPIGNTCETVTTITTTEKVAKQLNLFLTLLEKYVQDQEIENEHTKLKNALLHLGVDESTLDENSNESKESNESTEKKEKLESNESNESTEKKEKLKLGVINIKELENYIANTISSESKKVTEKIKDDFTKILDDKIKRLDVCTHFHPFDCMEILQKGQTSSGFYTIYPNGLYADVFCDMETDGGGWTVFLLRQKQTTQLNFRRTWKDYKKGFGNAPDEYWIGNDVLHSLTSSKNYSLRVEVKSPEGSPVKVWSEYSDFKVESEETKYRVTIAGRNVDSTMHKTKNFGYNNGMKFTTIDQDNDEKQGYNCAELDYQGNGGGFWYKKCSHYNPTNPYEKITFFHWSPIDATKRWASDVHLKIRPKK